MQLNTLRRNTKLARSARVGRGGKRGKTSGRGTKGQKARAGRKMRPELRDLVKKLPKRRGYGKNRARTVNASVLRPVTVSLAALSRSFPDGADVSPKTLLASRMLRRVGGSVPPVKVVGAGPLTKKLSVSGCAVSAGARKAIEAAGGKVS